MGRYHLTEKKKTNGLLVFTLIILFAIIGAAWLYFNEDKPGGVIKTENKTLPLPLPGNRTGEAKPAQQTLSAGTEPGSELASANADFVQEEQVVLPELNASDGFVREELLKLSSALSPWVQVDQLIRKFLLIINDFSEGTRLEKHMRFLKPEQPFSVEQDNEGMFIAESSYHRYDSLAAAIDAVNVEAALALYRKIRPLLLQVYREFSYPDGYRLEGIFLKAGAEILAAPVKTGRIGLVRPSVHYKFAEPQTEALNPVHKQMLRLGPDNTRIIQNKVRKLVEALSESGE